MGGGLLQIISYGSQDIFLTGNPEITFFKAIYRRHTNFSIDNIELNFDDDNGFGKTSTLIIPKIGDLLYKLYLKIELPLIDLKRNDATNDFLNEQEQAQSELNLIENYMRINLKSYTDSLIFINAENITNSERIIQTIQTNHQTAENIAIINDTRSLLSTTDFNKVDMEAQLFINSISSSTDKDLTDVILEKAVKESQRIHKLYFEKLKLAKEKHQDESDPNIKFAWIDKLGTTLIERIEIEIGGNTIERHYGDWLNIWWELSGNKYNETNYNKMIGNVSELTSFDREQKPKYNLYIPLQFWFCKTNGVALPLVALEYHNVALKVKIRELHEVSYIENEKFIQIPNSFDTINLNEVNDVLNIDLNISLLADFVYLDTNERKRFAQSSHEYLIEELQLEEYKNINNQEMQFLLDFEHPCKELIWVAQKTKFLSNDTGYQKTQFNNYSINDQNEIIEGSNFLIKDSTILFHGYDRVRKQDSKYFNYVQPHSFYRNTPSDGINVYSFALHPEEYQPSGTANFSRLSSAHLIVNFNDNLFPEEASNEDLHVRIYAKNYNILRILSGFAQTAYTAVV